jgi:hypothetical protein
MKLFRKLILSVVTAVAFMVPLASQPAATANSPQHQHRHRVYWVYYRTCPESAWVCYGGYYHVNQAVQGVNYFRYKGYDSYYR